MNDTAWSRVSDVLGRALDVPPADRDAFLNNACLTDDGTLDRALRLEVEALLDASDAADLEDALRSPVSSFVETTVIDDVPVGTSVGPWRLTGVLGEGGMGIVYRAERSDGLFEREVALKRLRSGPGRKKLAARLRAERQTLARLEHPGIARLYDGGVSEDGTPYLVLELIEGETVTAWASRTGASIEDRVRLFVKVCEAVAYAHARLVVHRDLKPSNVFVVEREGEARAKLLDFGIAKLLNTTDATQTSSTAMTPAYAAPEQLLGLEVTTATDVYALGVVLYELLAGERPYDVSGVTASEAERIVRESTPERPSSRTADRGLEGDLDVIVLKALAKEPERRYPTAAALADDLRRHLSGLPVEARPATIRYRVGRFIRRHKAVAVSAAVAVLALVGGLGAALWQASEARAEAVRAEAALEQAEGALTFLEESILLGDVQENEDDPRLSVVLDSASARADRVEDGGVARTIHLALASVYLGRQDVVRAEHHAERAAAGPARDLDFAIAQNYWAQALADGGDLEGALPHHDLALATLATLPDALYEQGAVRNVYAATLQALGRLDEAAVQYRSAIDFARRANDPGSESIALQNMSGTLIQLDRSDEAIVVLRELVALLKERGDAESTYGLAFAQVNVANALSSEDRDAEALTAYREAIATFEDRLGADHPETLAAHISLATQFHKMGRFEDAALEAVPALETVEATLPTDHPYTSYAQSVAGQALCDNGSPRRGAELQQASLDARRPSLPADHWIILNGESAYGACLARLGRLEQAEGLLTRSLATLTSTVGPEHRRTKMAQERLAAFQRNR